MKLFFNKLFDNAKNYLAALAAIAIAVFGVLFASQRRKIEKLETDNALKNAENVTKQKQGELNEIKKQSDKAEDKFIKSRDDYATSKSKLADLRRNRPKD